jgi:catechol 2,3-dioxygenase-like lactoylglutathione lyase family enzyme
MQNPSIMSHVSLGTNDFEKAKAFYKAVLATVGAKAIMEHPDAVAFGRAVSRVLGRCAAGRVIRHDRQRRTLRLSWPATNNRSTTSTKKHSEQGATSDGEPGPRAEYGEPYYGCFVRDLDGHKIEATFWDMPGRPRSC